MIVGYARTSTIEQEAGFEAQLKQLKAAGCEKVFSEQVSAVAATREQLEAALDFVREGDVSRLLQARPACQERSASLRDRRQAGSQGRRSQGAGSGDRHVHADRQAHVQLARRHRSVREGVDPRADAGRHRQGQGRRQIQGPRSDCQSQGRQGARASRRWRQTGRDCPPSRHLSDFGLSGSRLTRFQ